MGQVMAIPGAAGCSGQGLALPVSPRGPRVTAQSSETPRAGYHHFLLSQECRARAGCHHPAGRGGLAVVSVVPGLEPQLPPERDPLALPPPLGVTCWHRGPDPGRNEEQLVPEGHCRIIYSPKMMAGMQEGFRRLRAAPVGVWGRSVPGVGERLWGFGVYLPGELLGRGCSGPSQPVSVLWVHGVLVLISLVLVLFLVKRETVFRDFARTS